MEMGRRTNRGVPKKVRKGNASSAIGYEGTVTLTVKRGDKVVGKTTRKNEGREPLFKFLCGCLVGDYQPSGVPRFIMAYSDANATTSVMQNPLPIANTPEYGYESSGTSCYVEMVFVIPFGAFTVSGDSVTVKSLALFDANNKPQHTTPSAIIVLNDDGVTISTNENLIVGWKLTVGNQSDL